MTNPIGREPVFVVQNAVAVLLAATLFLNLSTDVQSLVNAVIVAAGGVAAAFMVAAERALPLLDGLLRAVLALVIGLGIDVPANVQAGIFATLAAIVAWLLRDRVTAPVQPPSLTGVVPPITRTTGGHV